MRNRFLFSGICVSAICLGVLVLPARANLVLATGAGPSLATAQDLTQLAPTEIIGDFNFNSTDPAVNLFRFHIGMPIEFSAFTTYTGAFGVPDPELFLFNSSGAGVYFNDDLSASNTQSCLPSADALTNPCPTASGFGPVLPGTYYLAITYSANGPVDAMGNEIFTNSASTDVVGPNPGVGRLAGWDGNSFTQPDTDLTGYDISISGTTALPEPSMLFPVLLIAAAFGIYQYRRMRKAR